jgi:hypothetical protein
MPSVEFGINFRGIIVKTMVPIGDSPPNVVHPLDFVAKILEWQYSPARRIERRVTVGLAARLPSRP